MFCIGEFSGRYLSQLQILLKLYGLLFSFVKIELLYNTYMIVGLDTLCVVYEMAKVL